MKACEIFIPLDSILDKEKERKRIGKQIEKLSNDINVLKSRLENENFVKKAPPNIIADSNRILKEQQSLLHALEKGFADLQ